MRVFVLKAPLKRDNDLLSNYHTNSDRPIEKLARLAFTELTELRHRGAFTAVAQAFAACCLRAYRQGNSTLLEQLYQVRKLENAC
jgi:Putative death-receptor fusion protein (DUF2428)